VKAGLRALISTAGLAVYAAREGERATASTPAGLEGGALREHRARRRQVIADPSANEYNGRHSNCSPFNTAYQSFLASAVDLNLAHHATLTSQQQRRRIQPLGG